MRKKLILISFPFILLAGIYFLGPEPARPVWDTALPAVPQNASELEHYIAGKESQHKVKPNNEARIVWADSTHKKTAYSVVYLHGFSGSQEEGNPVHRDFARKFGCNLYLSRLADHGIDTTEQLINFTSDRYWASAKQALAIGKAIGDHVIIMSTSTGGTIALILASDYPEDVSAIINMSPNISLFHPLAFISNNPWGVQIGRLVVGGKYYETKPGPGIDPKLKSQYWTTKYRVEAVAQLQEMLEDKMIPKTFEKVRQPSLSLYYYKNEKEQDSTVRVAAIMEMNKALGTPDSLKRLVAVPNAGDHVIGSYITSKDVRGVENEIDKFAIEVLHLKEAN